MPVDLKILHYVLKPNLGLTNLPLPDSLHSLHLFKHIRVFRFPELELCKSHKSATVGRVFDCIEAGRSEWLEHILERILHTSTINKFLSL